MNLLDALRDAARTVVDRAGPATVAIGRDGRGSGLVVAAGQVLTNAHNLRDRTTQVTFGDGRAVQATVAAVDPDGDLALLSVDTGGVTPLDWAPEPPATGDVVFAVGRGGRGLRISFGLVGATDRSFRGPRGRLVAGAVEHGAPLGRGGTGGPLVDPAGRLVALNTARLDDGFALAVPADDDLRQRLAGLASGRSVTRRRLGVAVTPPAVAARLRRSVGLPERDGLLVRAVAEGSPAAAAGIGQGDLLVRAAGRDLRTADDLFAALDSLDGDLLEVVLVRGVEELTLTVHLPADAP
jgi:S1-C subfamily serine protease